MDSSTLILVAPVIIDLFSNLCSCSFLSVPNPGGMPDKQPFSICFLVPQFLPLFLQKEVS